MLHSWYELAEAIAHEVGEVPLIPHVSARQTYRSTVLRNTVGEELLCFIYWTTLIIK